MREGGASKSAEGGGGNVTLIHELNKLKAKLNARDDEVNKLKQRLAASPVRADKKWSGAPGGRSRAPLRTSARGSPAPQGTPPAGPRHSSRSSGGRRSTGGGGGGAPSFLNRPPSPRRARASAEAHKAAAAAASSSPGTFGRAARPASPRRNERRLSQPKLMSPESQQRLSQLSKPTNARAASTPKQRRGSAGSVGFGSSGASRTPPARGARALPQSAQRAPRCASPATTQRSMRRAAVMTDSDAAMRQRWQDELERTKLLLAEKRRLENESMYAAEKQARDELRTEKLEEDRALLLGRMEREQSWRQEDMLQSVLEKQSHKREMAQRMREKGEAEERRRLEKRRELEETSISYRASISARDSADQRDKIEARRELQARKEAFEEQREAVRREKQKDRDAEKAEQLRRYELEFAHQQREACKEMSNLMVMGGGQ